MLLSLPFIVMILLLMLGVPIAFSLAGAGILGILLTTGDVNMLFGLLGGVTYNTIATYVLTTIPMFTLMAFLSSSGGLADDLFDAASKWLSGIKGGLAIGTVFACGIFGAMSGVSTAAASVMSKIALTNMRRIGYSETLSAGVVGVGSTLDVLIPPSITFIIYGIATETSIGKLLLAGIVPGVIMGVLLCFCIFAWVLIRPGDVPAPQQVSWPLRWRSLGRVWQSLLLIIIVTGLLYSGLATATEVGAIGAFVAGLIGVCSGRLKWEGVKDAFSATMRISSMIFMILIGAFIFSYFINLSGVPDKIIAAVFRMELDRWVVIIGIIVIYFTLSMFMDELPLMLLTLQLTFPLIKKLGFDPVWFGVISVMLVMMGLVFPPVGMICFIVSATGKVDLIKVYQGTSVLIVAIAATIALLMIYPEIAIWLPSTMG